MNDRTQHPGSRRLGRLPADGHQIVVGIVVLVVVIFALANLEDAKVDFVFADVTLPLFFVIVGSGLLGGTRRLFARARHHKDD